MEITLNLNSFFKNNDLINELKNNSKYYNTKYYNTKYYINNYNDLIDTDFNVCFLNFISYIEEYYNSVVKNIEVNIAYKNNILEKYSHILINLENDFNTIDIEIVFNKIRVFQNHTIYINQNEFLSFLLKKIRLEKIKNLL